MKTTYETQTNIYGKDLILRYVDGELDAFIPIDPANSDYQAYLNPVEHLTEIPTVTE